MVLPAVLTGMAFSFHSAVGLWGGAAVGIAFASQRPIKQTVVFAAWAAALAQPGGVTALDVELAKFMAAAAAGGASS